MFSVTARDEHAPVRRGWPTRRWLVAEAMDGRERPKKAGTILNGRTESENLSFHGTFQANELLANKIIRHLHVLITHLFIVIGNALIDELAPSERPVLSVFARGDRLDEGIGLRHVEERHR